MRPDDFALKYKRLTHYSPASRWRVEDGLLTASQILDRNADEGGRVRAKFIGDAEYAEYDADHWKTHARVKPGAGPRRSNVLVRDRHAPERDWFLGNNAPLGSDEAVRGLPFTENRRGEPPMTGESWLRLLNRMFWVFAEGAETKGFVEHVRAASADGRVTKVTLMVGRLPSQIVEGRMRFSTIGGGAISANAPRGTDTYRSLAGWSGLKPKEIGIVDGVSPEEVAELLREDALEISEV